MKTNYYRNESWVDSTFSKRGKWVLSLLAVVFTVGIIAGGCSFIPNMGGNNTEEPTPTPVADVNPAPTNEVKVPAENTIDVDVDTEQTSKMVEVSSTSVGRSDPFMPSGEIQAFENARRSAIAEANAHNARIAQIKKMKNVVIREPDDISPYSFNLPVPPTSLAPENAAAAKITRTKVVGIMYNKTSPSAIINIDNKDYLVRQGDKIMGQEYKVMQINPSWITVGLGSNIYSASIGELFSKDDLDKTRNDLYNLRNRFGGRKG